MQGEGSGAVRLCGGRDGGWGEGLEGASLLMETLQGICKMKNRYSDPGCSEQ